MAQQELIKKYAVIGNPIEHSLSPTIHEYFARKLNINLSYEKIFSDVDKFELELKKFFEGGGLGCNVTLPFKRDAFLFTEEKSDIAKITGAVNTISKKNGVYFGDNTDGSGFIRDLKKNIKFDIAGKEVLILGAGGASMGIIPNIFLEKPKSLKIFNRTLENAKSLVERFSSIGNINYIEKSDLIESKFDLIINATSQGMNQKSFDFTNRVFNDGSILYDLSYGNASKNIKDWAIENKIQFFDGLGMLIEQAADSFLIWEGERPNMIEELKNILIKEL
tara:strand:+ start:373 stop:1206 length:834 start_codon:yes stop_codon:yes gene_type:complete